MHIPRIDLTALPTRALMALTSVNEMGMYIKHVTIAPAEVNEDLGRILLPPEGNAYGYDASVTLNTRGVDLSGWTLDGEPIVFYASIYLVRCEELGGWIPVEARVYPAGIPGDEKLYKWCEDGRVSCMSLTP